MAGEEGLNLSELFLVNCFLGHLNTCRPLFISCDVCGLIGSFFINPVMLVKIYDLIIDLDHFLNLQPLFGQDERFLELD
jgi:hypothetical protein